MYRWKWTNRKYLFTYTNMYMQHTTYSIELIEGGFNNGERGRKENETNSTVNPWYKIVIKLASRSVNKARPHPRITENLRRYRKSRISFDFLRSRKLFPSDPPISTVETTTTFLALISVTESREKALAWKRNAPPHLCFLFNNRKSVEMNLSRTKEEGRGTTLLNQLETSKRILIRDIVILKTRRE